MSTSELCHTCTDGKGKLKSSYESECSAQSMADFICSEEGVSLRVYECPHDKGWHLTKSDGFR